MHIRTFLVTGNVNCAIVRVINLSNAIIGFVQQENLQQLKACNAPQAQAPAATSTLIMGPPIWSRAIEL